MTEYKHIGGTEMENSIQRANHISKLAMWAERVNSCRSSGLTVRQWCEESGIAQCTCYSWQKKWSVDIMYDKISDTYYLIDMARAENSAYWDPTKMKYD